MSFSANVEGLSALAAALRDCVAAVDAELPKLLGDDVGPLIGHAAERNANWSKKIPRTVRWTVSGNTVRIFAGYRSVPIAVWYENGHARSDGPWRHPVYPSRKLARKDWHWALQRGPLRPYLRPALAETKDEASQRIVEAFAGVINDTLGGAGA